MAWKRGVANNQAGAIRKGHIKEFLIPSSKKTGISASLLIMNTEDFVDEKIGNSYLETAHCLFSSNFPEFSIPEGEVLYIHAHEHPRCVLAAVSSSKLPQNCILLNEVQRINSKVCSGELESWTIYRGESYSYDVREGAIGNTHVRPSVHSIPFLSAIEIDVRLKLKRPLDTAGCPVSICYQRLLSSVEKLYFECIVSLEELCVLTIGDVQLVCRIANLVAESDTENDTGEGEAEEFSLPDTYRGLVDASTKCFVQSHTQDIVISQPDGSTYRPSISTSSSSSSSSGLKNIVHIKTNDDEIFPVKRRLLRPCIKLTSVVQAGKGIYKLNETHPDLNPTIGTKEDNKNKVGKKTGRDEKEKEKEKEKEEEEEEEEEDGNINVRVDIDIYIDIDIDACTFDRVLLYLEHEARGEEFLFDPLLASDLLIAGEKLGITGLVDVCNKTLGSFQDRVRKTPIRMSEINARNEKGRQVGLMNGGNRGETILVLSGMVLDITRWLSEHPGGSTIIPQQALGGDCTVFFELYHASRQSFLYLKEFYIGELDQDDLRSIKSLSAEGVRPSVAFTEQLNRVTSWRLKPEQLINYEIHKSF